MDDARKVDGQSTMGQGFSIFVAVVIVALIVGQLAFVSGIEFQKRLPETPHSSIANMAEATSVCADKVENEFADCVYEHVSSSQEQLIARQDLAAQQSMKFWAAVMAYLGLGSLILTGLALYFVRGTLIATRDAVGETAKATEAMVAQNLISEKSNELAQRGSRPWMGLEDFHLPDLLGDDLRLVVKFKNSGKSPAITKVGTSWQFVGSRREIPRVPLITKKNEIKGASIIMPDGVTSSVGSLDAEAVKWCHSQETSACFRTDVWYDDAITGTEHLTTVIYYFDFEDGFWKLHPYSAPML